MLDQFGAEMQTDEREGMMTNSTVAGRQCAELVIKITHGDEQNQKGSDETTLTNTSGLDNVTEKTTMGSFPMKNAGSDEYMGVQMLTQEDAPSCMTPWLDDQPSRPLEMANFVNICGSDQQNRLGGLPLPLPPPPTVLAAETLHNGWDSRARTAGTEPAAFGRPSLLLVVVTACQQIIRELHDEVQYLRRMLVDPMRRRSLSSQPCMMMLQYAMVSSKSSVLKFSICGRGWLTLTLKGASSSPLRMVRLPSISDSPQN